MRIIWCEKINWKNFSSSSLLSLCSTIWRQYEFKIQNARKRKVTVEISIDGLRVNLKKRKKKVRKLISNLFPPPYNSFPFPRRFHSKKQKCFKCSHFTHNNIKYRFSTRRHRRRSAKYRKSIKTLTNRNGSCSIIPSTGYFMYHMTAPIWRSSAISHEMKAPTNLSVSSSRAAKRWVDQSHVMRVNKPSTAANPMMMILLHFAPALTWPDRARAPIKGVWDAHISRRRLRDERAAKTSQNSSRTLLAMFLLFLDESKKKRHTKIVVGRERETRKTRKEKKIGFSFLLMISRARANLLRWMISCVSILNVKGTEENSQDRKKIIRKIPLRPSDPTNRRHQFFSSCGKNCRDLASVRTKIDRFKPVCTNCEINTQSGWLFALSLADIIHTFRTSSEKKVNMWKIKLAFVKCI